MYVYLSKKITVQNNSLITASAWNKKQGFVAAGTDSGLVKVIKLEVTEGKDPKARDPKSSNTTNLIMNSSLEGHASSISSVVWNDTYNKLSTADSNGRIVIWNFHRNEWTEEMVNKRDMTIVTSMKWSSDGEHICIVYNDGVIIMGSLEGSRIWVKELKNSTLTHVEWAPDKRFLLIGLINGEIHVYDFNGEFVDKLNVQCLDSLGVRIAAIDWYDGQNGFISNDSPALAICYTNGRCQIMKNELDEKPIVVDCQMEIICAQWNHDGSILAIGGLVVRDDKETNVVQFYNPWGLHLKTLKVPGKKLASVNWEGNGLRLVITVDSLIYFANLRPSYKWCSLKSTIVYSYTKPTKNEQCIIFFDTKTGEKNIKYMKNLLGVAGAGEYCILIAQGDDSHAVAQSSSASALAARLTNQKLAYQVQYAIVLCNSIGTPIEQKYIDFQPANWSMNTTHILVSSKSYFYIWNYSSMVDRTLLKKQSFEKLVFIDNPNIPVQIKSEDSAIVAVGPSIQETKNSILATTMSDKHFFVARQSGYIQKFDLATANVAQVYLNESNGIIASKIIVNSNSTKMAVVDTNSVMRLIDLTISTEREDWADFKRTDVWNVVWASDNPDMYVCMEKTKMMIFRDTQSEEPISCSGYICEFSELQVKVVFLDDIMSRVDSPKFSDIVDFDTKYLRDTRDLLEKVDLTDATHFIEQNPHTRLWKLLSEAALNKMDLGTAEHAFVKLKDYYGIEFVKKLQNIHDQNLRKAEVCAYFNMFEESEIAYLEQDRKDLAYVLRKKLGDWFKVLQLLKLDSEKRILDDTDILETDMVSAAIGSGTDVQLEEAYNEIGDFHFERQNWNLAVRYYIMSRNIERQADCYYVLEDYDSLSKIMDQLPENSELLSKIANMFESVGMCKEACEAYVKAQSVKAAVDVCVKLNQWDEGVRLAKQYNIGHVDELLAKQANKFLEQSKIFNAIELYRKAKHFLDAARLMFEVAEKETNNRNSPVLIKKMYVLAGLLVEQYRDLIKSGGIFSKNKVKEPNASTALDGILSEEASIAIKDSKILDNCWHGAEAYHFLMLCERQLREGKIDAAFKTSMALTNYEDILKSKNIYSLIALCACGNGSYNIASKAFIKLESSNEIPDRERKDFETLAFQIFSYHQPKDKKPALKGECPQCATRITEWHTNCPNCDTKFAPCIVSGRPILETQFWVCGSCKHRAIEQEIANRISCPLCHMPVR